MVNQEYAKLDEEKTEENSEYDKTDEGKIKITCDPFRLLRKFFCIIFVSILAGVFIVPPVLLIVCISYSYECPNQNNVYNITNCYMFNPNVLINNLQINQTYTGVYFDSPCTIFTVLSLVFWGMAAFIILIFLVTMYFSRVSRCLVSTFTCNRVELEIV